MEKPHNTPEAVQTYYDEWTPRYIDSFGDVFQALQTKNPRDFFRYVGEQINLSSGMNVLDAGAGIGGPAIHLASLYDVNIEALTISENQVALGYKKIAQASNLLGHINMRKGDFHKLTDYYDDNTFDAVVFFESLVHSHDPAIVIDEVRRVLKPHGTLYIKDLFKGPDNPNDPKFVTFAQDATNEQFCLHIRPMGEIIDTVTRAGFRVTHLRTPVVDQDFDKGNEFTARHLMKLRMDQSGPWRDEGFIFLHWMEILSTLHY